MALARLVPRPSIRPSPAKEKDTAYRQVVALANPKGGGAKTTTAPKLGNAFVAATGVIVPVQTEYLSLRGLVQLENTLEMVRENLNPEVSIIGIVPTMFDKRITHSREADEILRENFGDLVYQTRIRKTIRFAEAPVKGTSVLGYEPSGEAAEMYRDLAKEVLRGEEARQHA